MFKKKDKVKHSDLILTEQNIYSKQLINFKLEIPFKKYTSNVDEYIIDYAKKNICNRCFKEGYISDTNVKIINKTAGMLDGSKINYNVLYEFDVFVPHEDLELYVKVNNITKIGIKAVITDDNNKNPLVVFASRIHNDHISMNDEESDQNNNIDTNKRTVSIGDIIKVKVIGNRYEIFDPSIYILGIII